MLRCTEVTRLASEKLDRKLSLSETIRMNLHLMMCRGCSNFKTQMDDLRNISRAYRDGAGEGDDTTNRRQK